MNNNNILYFYDEESPGPTEFRRLYSRIRGLSSQGEMKNFLITSPSVGEGKSTLAAFLAIAISKYRDTKTLLVDCDLRRPVQHKFFGLEREGGIAEVLTKGVHLKTCFKPTPLPNLKILTSGLLDGSPVELFNSNLIKEIFTELKFYFQTIVVDCAPVIPVSDPLILSSEMDGVILVVEAGKTQKEVAKRAVDLLKEGGVNLIGVVMNNARKVLPYYYDYKYYGYKYYNRPKVGSRKPGRLNLKEKSEA